MKNSKRNIRPTEFDHDEAVDISLEELEVMRIDEPFGMNYTEGGRIYQNHGDSIYDDEKNEIILKSGLTKRVPYGYLN